MQSAWLAVALGFACGCAKAGDESQAKRAPGPPPPPGVEIPAALSVPVEVHGKPAAPIDAARLAATAPDFVDDDHRAWRLTALLAQELRGADAAIEAVGSDGVAISLPTSSVAGSAQPALVLTRRGKVAAAMIDPAEPFPAYHGQGGRLKRRGDPLPRIEPLRLLRVVARRTGGDNLDRGQMADASALTQLRLSVAGQPVTLSAEVLAGLPTVPLDADGESRPGWSLHALADAVSAGARVVAVIGADERRIAIDEASWRDGSRQPVLRTNRRGTQLKFAWARAGVVDRNDELHEVAALELVR
jgi:hypothetical protein